MSIHNRDTVLVITNRFDEHASHVIRRCNERSIPVFRLNTEDFPREMTLVVQDDAWELRYHDRVLTPDRIRSCWYRRPSDAVPHDEVTDTGAQMFVRDECKYVLDGLYRCLKDITWVSHPDALQAAKYKLRQLDVARTIGFAVPPTLVTNDPDAVRMFADAYRGGIIVKVAGRGPTTIPVDRAVYTTLLTPEDLTHIDDVRYAPHCFQAYIEKAYEVRVTVIGDDVFAVRIDSQASPKTRVDWRRYDFANVPHTAITLPPKVADRCQAVVRSFGLAFGAIDLIVTPRNEWVFLEINPNGQWLWLEELTGLPMTAALIAILKGRMSFQKEECHHAEFSEPHAGC